MMTNSRFLMTLGLLLLSVGIIFPFLMLIRVVTPTFLLIFISSGSSTLGLAFGMVGLSRWTGDIKEK